MPTIYVFCNNKDCDGRGDWHNMIAIAEDGTCLAGHVCSHHGWAAHDMGIEPNGWKREIYAKHYPDGFEVKWVEHGAELDRVITSLPPPPASQAEAPEKG